MITLHTWATPNGRKISIMLEEIGEAFDVIPVDITADAQFKPEFLAIAPNNKIPAIVDDAVEGEPLTIFESGAILFYLAEKSGQLLPAAIHERMSVLAWLNWQMGGLGPMLGQLGFFAVRSKEKAPLAIDRFRTEVDRLMRVMDTRLASVRFLGGETYSIADIASYPWIVAASTFLAAPLEETLAAVPNVIRWRDEIGTRPAVQRGMAIPVV